jgi:hypothetical protein
VSEPSSPVLIGVPGLAVEDQSQRWSARSTAKTYDLDCDLCAARSFPPGPPAVVPQLKPDVAGPSVPHRRSAARSGTDVARRPASRPQHHGAGSCRAALVYENIFELSRAFGDPLIAKHVRVVENCPSSGHRRFLASPSDGLCRTLVVVSHGGQAHTSAARTVSGFV